MMISSRCFRNLVCVVIAAAGLAASHAQLFIEVGLHPLQPDQSGQIVDLFVENRGTEDIQVTGLTFNAQVADSGPISEGGSGVIDGPNITAVDIVSGTVFDANNLGQLNLVTVPQSWSSSVMTQNGTTTALAAGTTTRLARLTLTTETFSTPQTWDLKVFGTAYLDENSVPILPTVTEGAVSVVPEPVHSTIAALALIGLVLLRRRERLIRA